MESFLKLIFSVLSSLPLLEVFRALLKAAAAFANFAERSLPLVKVLFFPLLSFPIRAPFEGIPRPRRSHRVSFLSQPVGRILPRFSLFLFRYFPFVLLRESSSPERIPPYCTFFSFPHWDFAPPDDSFCFLLCLKFSTAPLLASFGFAFSVNEVFFPTRVSSGLSVHFLNDLRRAEQLPSSPSKAEFLSFLQVFFQHGRDPSPPCPLCDPPHCPEVVMCI